MYRAMIAALILAFTAMPAFSADNGFYVGAAVGQAGVDGDVDLGAVVDDFDGDDTGFKGIVGFRPLEWFAVELNYVDLGTAEDNVTGVDVDVETTGIDAFAVLYVPFIPVVDIFGKVGAISWDQDVSLSGLTSASDDGTDLAYGIGVGVGFGNLGARLEYERFEIPNTHTVDMISLGLTWTFL